MPSLYEWFEKHQDPHTKDWISTSPIILFVPICAYLLFHVIYGTYQDGTDIPFMFRRGWVTAKNWVLLVYNLQLFCGFGKAFLQIGVNPFCQPVRETGSVKSRFRLFGKDNADRKFYEDEVANLMFIFFISRIGECADTMLQSFRGVKPRSWTIHHHAFAILLAWIGITFVPGGTAAFAAMLNAFCHAIAYAKFLIDFYFQGLIPAKLNDHINRAQLIIIFIICLTSMIINCGFPIDASLTLLTVVTMMLGFWWTA